MRATSISATVPTIWIVIIILAGFSSGCTGSDAIFQGLDSDPGDTGPSDLDSDPGDTDPCSEDDPLDSDQDGVCDADDVCPGFDDSLDADSDGVPDGCEIQDVDQPTDVGDEWSYFKGISEPPSSWNAPGFDDGTWESGATGIGYNSECSPATELADMRNSYVTVYMRRTFNVSDPSVVGTLTLTMDYDDGFVAYLNGFEVARSNVSGSPPAFDQLADADHECSGSLSNANPPEHFDIDPTLLVAGDNVLAIQAHNLTLGSSDFVVIPILSSCGSVCGNTDYCDGVEYCDLGECVAEDVPCDDGLCDETLDECTDPDPTAEICDQVDNDGDSETDEGLTCNEPFADDFPAGSAGLWRTQIGTIASGDGPRLNEASGLVVSRRNPDVFWSHQDNSGDERIFALDSDGTYLGTWDLDVNPARDPEDIAIGPGPISGESYIYFGDIGYNNGIWGCTTAYSSTGNCTGCAEGINCQERDLKVWRALEPTVDRSGYVDVTGYAADTITFEFPDANMLGKKQDVETLMVDPIDGYAYIVTKRISPTLVFRGQISQASDGDVITLEYVASLSSFSSATAGDISLDGSLIVIRNYGTAYIWDRLTGESIADALSLSPYVVSGISETQGEAIAFDLDNSGQFFTTSEGSGNVPIYFYARDL